MADKPTEDQEPAADTEQAPADLLHAEVDVNEWGPTEQDEELVLQQLYGAPDDEGIYRGEFVD